MLFSSKMSKEELINSIIESIKDLDEDISTKDYISEYSSILRTSKSIEDRIRVLDIEGCIQLFNELKEMIKKQEEETGYAKPATGAYYEYMFYRVPNIEERGKTRTHNK